MASVTCRLTAEDRVKLYTSFEYGSTFTFNFNFKVGASDSALMLTLCALQMLVLLLLLLSLMSLDGVACVEMSSTDTVYCWLAVRHLVARWSGDLTASGSRCRHNAQSLLPATMTSHLNIIFIWRGQKAGCQWRTQASQSWSSHEGISSELVTWTGMLCPAKESLKIVRFIDVVRFLMKLYTTFNKNLCGRDGRTICGPSACRKVHPWR